MQNRNWKIVKSSVGVEHKMFPCRIILDDMQYMMISNTRLERKVFISQCMMLLLWLLSEVVCIDAVSY